MRRESPCSRRGASSSWGRTRSCSRGAGNMRGCTIFSSRRHPGCFNQRDSSDRPPSTPSAPGFWGGWEEARWAAPCSFSAVEKRMGEEYSSPGMARSVPRKKETLLAYLARGIAMVHLDARRAGVVVPSQYSMDAHLRLNLSYRYGIPDLD